MKTKKSGKKQPTTILAAEKFKRNYMEKMLKELKKDEKWKMSIAEELNCKTCEVKKKILEKFQKILTSSMSNSLLEIDEKYEHIMFNSTTDAFSFFEEVSVIFQCNLDVNELSVRSNINYIKHCSIHLTQDNILCEITSCQETGKSEDHAKNIITQEIVKTQLFPDEDQSISSEDAKSLERFITDEEETTEEGLKSLIKVCEETQTKLRREHEEACEETQTKLRREKRKREHEETDDTKRKNFKRNIQSIPFKKETDAELLTTHLNERLADEVKSDLEKITENIPKIKKTFDTIYNFVHILDKTLRQIPKYKDEKTQEWKVSCEGCPIHCVPNWHFTNPTGRPSTEK